MSEDKLKGSFEPDNTEGMLLDYYSVSNTLYQSIKSLNNINGATNPSKLLVLIKTLQHRKNGIERQLEIEGIPFIKK